jgi:thioredoxin reductase (NADPH)
MNKIYDIAIIGAGPVGLFAGFQAGVNNMDAILIDTLDVVGGQCSMLYPEKFIYDVPGHEKITAQNLINNLKKQCDRFNHDYLLGNQVVELSKENNIYILRTDKGFNINSRTVVVCAGGGSFNPNKPAVENIEKFENKSVFYLINDLKKFHNKNVMIAGGGDSAVDWSLMLMNHEFSPKKIYFVHRRSEMKCHPSSLEELKSLEGERFEFKIPYVLDNLIGCYEKGELQSVALRHFENEDDRHHIEIDYLLPFFGLKGDINAIKNFGLYFNKSKIPVDSGTMESSVSGIYAIGDICEYLGKTKLLVSGFHEASVACNSIDEYLSKNFNRQKRAFEYSTSKFN